MPDKWTGELGSKGSSQFLQDQMPDPSVSADSFKRHVLAAVRSVGKTTLGSDGHVKAPEAEQDN